MPRIRLLKRCLTSTAGLFALSVAGLAAAPAADDPPRRNVVIENPGSHQVEATIRLLQAESFETSLSRLDRINAYVPLEAFASTTTTIEFPLAERLAQRDIDRILSSRRFTKVLDEAKAMGPVSLAPRLRRELVRALDQYEAASAEHLASLREWLRSSQTVPGPKFKMYDGPDPDKPTLVGLRHKLLALCLLAGECRVEGCRAAVLRASQQAWRQYEELRDDAEIEFGRRFTFLWHAGPYSRQAMAIGLIGTASESTREQFLKKYSERQVIRSVPRFTSLRTEFDIPLMGKIDESPGRVTVTVIRDLTDEEFVELFQTAER